MFRTIIEAFGQSPVFCIPEHYKSSSFQSRTHQVSFIFSLDRYKSCLLLFSMLQVQFAVVHNATGPVLFCQECYKSSQLLSRTSSLLLSRMLRVQFFECLCKTRFFINLQKLFSQKVFSWLVILSLKCMWRQIVIS